MKTKILYLFAAVALMLGFAQCTKDEDTDADSRHAQEAREQGVNELQYVVGQLCELDEQQQVVGYKLSRLDSVLAPTVLYAGAETVEEAKKGFKQILPETAQKYITNDGTEVKLYDAEGQLQCTLTLQIVDKADEVAVINFSTPHAYDNAVTQVHLIPEKAWGENLTCLKASLIVD